jgi:ABC-type microcin C transport system permease subunit YejB
MERFNGNIGSFQSAFYQTPKVFESVRVNLPVNVFLGMVNDSMSVFLIQSPIGVAIIGRELRAAFDVISNKSPKGTAFTRDTAHHWNWTA